MTPFEFRAGEKRPASLAFVAMVLVMAAHTSLETVRDALFLTRLGTGRLAVVMGLLAVLSLGLARANVAMVRSLGRRNTLIFTLVGAAWGTGLFAVIPMTATVVFGLYLFSALAGTLLLAQLWVCTADHFTVAQGRRLFPFIGAGAVVGAVLGAFGTGLWLTRGGFRPLLLGAACLFVGTAAIITALESGKRALSIEVPQDQPGSDPATSPFRSSPYAVRVAALVALATAGALVADYMFKTRVAASMPEARLGPFLATYYGVCNVAALLVQILLARPLLRRLGVTGALLVLPLALLLGAAGILLSGGALVAVLLAKGVDGSLRHSLQRLCAELVILPLSADVRSRIKPLFDGVVGRGVQAVVSVVLLGLSSAKLATTPVLATLLALLTAAWTVAAVGLRAPYLDLFRAALARGTLERGGDTALDRGAIESILQALSSREEARVLGAMQLLEDRGAVGLIPGLILFHESERVLERALAIFGASSRDDWRPLAERLLTHPAAAVRLAAVRALGTSRLSAVSAMIHDSDAAVRAFAAFALAEPPLENSPLVRAILEASGPSGRAGREGLLSAIAAEGDPRWSEVLAVLLAEDSTDPDLHEAAAIARVGDRRFLPRLVDGLGVPGLKSDAEDALVTFGETGLRELERALANVGSPQRVRRAVPLAIARFRTQHAADVLVGRLAYEPSGAIRFRILRGLDQLAREPRIQFPRELIEDELRRNLREHARLAALLGRMPEDCAATEGYGRLLLELLEDKRLQAVERVFRILQLAHRGEDVRSLYYALRSPDVGARANAFEFLQALTTGAGRPAEAMALLRLATDDLSPLERNRRALDLVEALPEAGDAVLERLTEDLDAAIAQLASQHLVARRIATPAHR